MRFLTIFLALSFFIALGEPVGAASEVKIAQIRSLWDQGKYLEAQEQCEPFLMPEAINTAVSELQSYCGDINLKVLFSRHETFNSMFHTVQKGESLYKIAKTYGVAIDLIKKSNGLEKDTIYPGMKLKIQQGQFSIRVDKSENELELLLDDKLLKRYPVATGKDNGTPVGEFIIRNKLENPTWFHAGAIVPPESQDNILGTRWLGFDYQGYGIHGTTDPDSIGKQVTSGCVRMLNQDVEEIYSIVPRGTKVVVKD